MLEHWLWEGRTESTHHQRDETFVGLTDQETFLFIVNIKLIRRAKLAN
jgi:hypothetical protein